MVGTAASVAVSLGKAAVRFCAGLQFVHKRPSKEGTKHATGVCYSTSKAKVVPLFAWLASNMNEVNWSDRLHPMNHTTDFPHYVTGLIDTAFVQAADCTDPN